MTPADEAPADMPTAVVVSNVDTPAPALSTKARMLKAQLDRLLQTNTVPKAETPSSDDGADVSDDGGGGGSTFSTASTSDNGANAIECLDSSTVTAQLNNPNRGPDGELKKLKPMIGKREFTDDGDMTLPLLNRLMIGQLVSFNPADTESLNAAATAEGDSPPAKNTATKAFLFSIFASAYTDFAPSLWILVPISAPFILPSDDSTLSDDISRDYVYMDVYTCVYATRTVDATQAKIHVALTKTKVARELPADMSEKKVAELKEKLDRAPVLARIMRFDAFFPRRSEWQTLMDEFNLSQTLCSEYLQVRNDARTAYAAKVLAPENDSKQCDNADADTPVASGEVDSPTS